MLLEKKGVFKLKTVLFNYDFEKKKHLVKNFLKGIESMLHTTYHDYSVLPGAADGGAEPLVALVVDGGARVVVVPRRVERYHRARERGRRGAPVKK